MGTIISLKLNNYFFKAVEKSKAYISLQHKTIRVGSWHWLRPPTPKFCVGDTNIRYLKTLKFALPQMGNIKFALPPTQNPNASQWNIGCVGSPTQNFRIGHVYFKLFVLISFALGWLPSANPVCSGVWALVTFQKAVVLWRPS